MSICQCGKEIKKGIKCPTCITREWRKKNPKKRKAIEQRYYLKHKKDCIVRAEEWNKKHPEKHKKSNRIAHDNWIKRNRERWNEYQRDYRRKKHKQ